MSDKTRELKRLYRSCKSDLSDREHTCASLRMSLCERKLRLKELESENKQLKDEIKGLHAKLLMKAERGVMLKRGDKNAYSDDVRKTVISLVSEVGVSTANVSKVMDIVGRNIFHHSFKERLPCAYTCQKMCDEGYVVSQIQTTESVLKAENVTLHCDGTSRDQKKIVSLTTDSGETLHLGYQPVGTEDASTVLDLTVDLLKNVSHAYGDMSSLTCEELLDKVKPKVTSTVTDRAATMKSFGKKLEEHFREEFFFFGGGGEMLN